MMILYISYNNFQPEVISSHFPLLNHYVQFHENGQSPYNHDFDYRQINWIKPGMVLHVVFGQSTEVQHLDKTGFSCIKDDTNKMPDCVNKYFSKKLGCILPWSTNPTETICEGKDKFQQFKNLSMSILKPQIKKELNQAGCFVPNCYKRTWDIKSTNVWPSQNFSRMSFSIFQNSKLTVKKEVTLYTFTNFFAEIGGYLGLFLGESIASFIFMSMDWVKVIAKTFKKKCKRGEDAPSSVA